MKNINFSTKKLSKTQLVDMDLCGQIHGARLDLLNLESLRDSKEISRVSDFPRFNVFHNWFGEVDLVQGNCINITFFGPYYDLRMAMQVYGLCSSIKWDFMETPVSQLEEHKSGQLVTDDLIGIYRNSVPISPLQGNGALLLKMASKGARKCIFGSMIEGDIETLDKKKNTGMSLVMSMVYPNTLIETIEKSTQIQKLIMIANLIVKIDDAKKDILSMKNPQTKTEPTKTRNQSERKRKAKNGKAKRRGRV